MRDYLDGKFALSSKCKVLTLLTISLVAIEIVSVNRWERTKFVSQGQPYRYRDAVQQYAIMENNEGGDKLSNTTNQEQENEGKPERGQEIRPIKIEKDMEGAIKEGQNDNLDTGTKEDAKSSPGGDSNVEEENAGDNKTQEQLVERLPSGKLRLTKQGQEELDRRLKQATEKKLILTWIPMFGSKQTVEIPQEKCGNCEVTYDRNMINDERTGALVFHFDALRASNMPPKRNLNQLYIYWDIESTATLRIARGHSLRWEDSFKFNGTMTYRRDSMFYMSYEHAGIVSEIVEANTLSLEDILKLKSRMAVAVISNCGSTPGARIRMKMIKQLISFNFGLEGYGGCFPGGRNFAGGKSRSSPEFISEVRKFKFYFSFENSFHCKDYITEKFFNNALRSFSVPVVWGTKKEDYEAVAPPESFIFANDFSSMKELAEYLQYLDKNDTAYLEYLKWLTMPPSAMPQYGRARGYCHICHALHGINVDDIYNPNFDEKNMKRPLFTDGIAHRTVEHLIDWFYGEDYPECFNR